MNRVGVAVLASALAALLLAACGGDADDQEAPRIVVVDYNILHGLLNEDEAAEPFDRAAERFALTAQALAELKPEIILLQEVFLNTENDYPDVRQILLDALGPDYATYHGDIRGNEINAGAPLGQLIITRLEVTVSDNFFVGGARSITHVKVQTEGGPVDVYDTHLEGTGAVIEAGEPEALIEIEKVLDFINDTRSGTAPVILAGDFNAEPDESSILRLLDEGYIDVLATGGDATCVQAGDPGCTNSTIPLGDNADNAADHRIDYIFVLAGTELSFEVVEAQLFNNAPVDIGDGRLLWPSDHIGVQAVLELVEP